MSRFGNGCGRVMGHGIHCTGECGWCQEIMILKRQLEISQKALDDLVQPCTRSDYTVGDLDRVVSEIAQIAKTEIKNAAYSMSLSAFAASSYPKIQIPQQVLVKEAIQNEEDKNIFKAINKRLNKDGEIHLEIDKTSIIRFKTKDGIYEPDRIAGKREDIEAAGFKILGEESEDSWMWDFENVDVVVPDKEFKVELDFDIDDDGCGDILFAKFTFGYADVDDFEIVSGYNPFDEQDRLDSGPFSENALKESFEKFQGADFITEMKAPQYHHILTKDVNPC